MTIKVIGKRHIEGTSKKTGRPYNMNEVHYNGKDKGVEGLAALTLLLQEEDYPFAEISINADYRVKFILACDKVCQSSCGNERILA